MKRFLAVLVSAFVIMSAVSSMAEEKKAAAPAKDDLYAAQTGMYWEKWNKGVKGLMPPCGTGVMAVGGDEILQATVDTYCAVKPGVYAAFINPSVYNIYKSKGNKYPDGKVAVLQFKEIGVAFTTDIQGGKPVYDVVSIKDGKSIASKEKGHPLNPEVCASCHASHKNVCVDRGYTCGNRTDY